VGFEVLEKVRILVGVRVLSLDPQKDFEDRQRDYQPWAFGFGDRREDSGFAVEEACSEAHQQQQLG
jgi:hypothetical protein